MSVCVFECECVSVCVRESVSVCVVSEREGVCYSVFVSLGSFFYYIAATFCLS